jgi:hypothetical protein
MKTGTTRHPKMRALARALDVPLPTAVGILQLLWEFASEFAPDGAVGKFTDEYIAEACGWDGNPSLLTASLSSEQSRWLDPHEVFRLTIHDWPEHCEYTVHNRIARSKRFFADGSAPKLSRLAEKERKDAVAFYSESARAAVERMRQAHGTSARDVRTEQAHEPCALDVRTPSAPLPVPVPMPKPEPKPIRAGAVISMPPSGEALIRETSERMYARHPKKRNLVLIPGTLTAAIAAVADPAAMLIEIEKVHAAWCDTAKWNEDDGRFAPKLDEWIADRGYTKWPGARARERPLNLYTPPTPIEESKDLLP